MRYWISGEDEDYERELARATRWNIPPPAPLSGTILAGIVLLAGGEALLFLSMIAACWLQ